MKTCIVLLITIWATLLGSDMCGVRTEAAESSFIRRQGSGLVVGPEARPIRLRGINFNNLHWELEPSLIYGSKHHGEIDFERISEMGMNVIRFNLTYRAFEEDAKPYHYKEEGWKWLDQNIQWAKRHGLYLIMDMHVPQGGYQGGGDTGFPLWENPENQARLKALWAEMVRRYKNETCIAAWSLLNEPTPTEGQAQWEKLANQLITEIRTEDKHHLIIVERPLIQGGELFLVDDDNVMYEAHFYDPGHYTEQYSFPSGRADGGPYPAPEVSVIPDSGFNFAETIENPRVPPGNSGWHYYEGKLHQVGDPEIIVGLPAFCCGKNQGTVYFDDFTVHEYDQDQNLVRRVYWADMALEDDVYSGEWGEFGIDPYPSATNKWHGWSPDGGGTHGPHAQGRWSTTSMAIENVTEGYSLSNYALSFAVRHGFHYKISGWMRGKNVSHESCMVTIEFGTLPVGTESAPFDPDYLKGVLNPLVGFSRRHNVPLNIGEFGLTKWCLQDGKGGADWVRDMIKLFEENDLHYQWYDYHSEAFGLYLCQMDRLPEDTCLNRTLFSVFQSFLPRCPDCSGSEVVIRDMTIFKDTSCECTATDAITFGTRTTIRGGATLTVRAPKIRIKGGFHMEEGAMVRLMAP